MIAEWWLDIQAVILAWFLDLFGDDPIPTWIADVSTFIGEIFARAAGLGAWFPFPLLATLAVGLLALWLTFWIVKAIRWLWGLTPFSGGS